MKKIRTAVLALAMIMVSLISYSQQGGGKNRGAMSQQHADNEKTALLQKITDLTTDQKTMLDQVYADFVAESKSIHEANEGADREVMKSKMKEVRDKKTASIKALLNDGQYQIYEETLKEARQSRKGARGQR